MDFIQLLVLGLIQGLTEFLPISSSGHLILVSILANWPDQGLLMDIAAHAGSLLAVLAYFRQDLKNLYMAITGRSGQKDPREIRLAGQIIIATLPILVIGVLFADFIEQHLRSTAVIATTTILFGLVLWWADVQGKREKTEHQLSGWDALLIGVSQALALIPGTSRSGITMSAALLLGLNRVAAARFSFLLSVPTISLAVCYKLTQALQAPVDVDWFSIITIFTVSAVVAYTCIHYFLKLIEKIGMLPFVIYRLVLGVGLWLLIF